MDDYTVLFTYLSASEARRSIRIATRVRAVSQLDPL